MACRDLLLKLEQQGQIVLPRRKSEAFVRGGNISIIEVPHDTTVIAGKLKDMLPLKLFGPRIYSVDRLTELWSLFDFINPGYLGSSGEFSRKFVNVIATYPANGGNFTGW
ncbi:MAG TPA: hypothetical protein DER33_10115 [Syntrophomonas sp.]|jgi:hypothetical protein|nr:hypothetical protein [Syntrophomonas sp.]